MPAVKGFLICSIEWKDGRLIMMKLKSFRASLVLLTWAAFVCSRAGAAKFDLDFETDPENLGVEFFGTAEYREDGGNPGGYLSVTDAFNDQRGAIVFPDLENGAALTAFSISADLRVGGGTSRPADGFSFNFARPDDPVLDDGEDWASSPTNEANLPEEGTTTGLAIGFDEWYSGGDDVIGMSIRIDNELVDQFEFPVLNGEVDDTESLQTGPEAVPEEELDVLGWARLTLDLSQDNHLVVTYKGVTVFDRDIDYSPSPGLLVFGGRTGNSNAYHHIDNISIATNEDVGGGGVTGDFNNNGALDGDDIDLLSDQVRSPTPNTAFDLTADGAVNAADRDQWVNVLKKTYYGDSNLDGQFNSTDFVVVFTAGQYEDAAVGNSTWATGDWNGDREFNSTDFVAAFQAGGYEKGPRPAAASVPEPSALVLLLLGVWVLRPGRRLC
jgi:hypothetical protein